METSILVVVVVVVIVVVVIVVVVVVVVVVGMYPAQTLTWTNVGKFPCVVDRKKRASKTPLELYDGQIVGLGKHTVRASSGVTKWSTFWNKRGPTWFIFRQYQLSAMALDHYCAFTDTPSGSNKPATRILQFKTDLLQSTRNLAPENCGLGWYLPGRVDQRVHACSRSSRRPWCHQHDTLCSHDWQPHCHPRTYRTPLLDVKMTNGSLSLSNKLSGKWWLVSEFECECVTSRAGMGRRCSGSPCKRRAS